MTIIICAVIYILSAFGFYKFVQLIYYHPKGSWQNIEPDYKELFLMFFPIINTFACVICWCLGWKHEKYRTNKIVNFFKPKSK